MATPGFLEEYAKDFAAQAKGAYSVPIDTSQFTGRQFVAGEDPLQTQAINLATQGVGGYQPFLSSSTSCTNTSSWNCRWTWCINRCKCLSTFYVSLSTTMLLIQLLQNLIDQEQVTDKRFKMQL